ncbi:glycosyltransferase family 2 protein [Oricola thermophila]|uniref:Glycosyltransferase n=1 Tax=Oricola thermophila TaxID=2742145 RepID=A0A6N1VB86_9HYPH|nr:glycosyltransferase [Oricola thermophila]QKV17928.1 glycosyltransferase [Oricola thermophila]
MKLVVVIATLGRKEQIAPLLSRLEKQVRLPDEVVISAPDSSHIGDLGSFSFPVTTLFGRTGLTAQRNTALEYAVGRFDLITFFDDDFIPADGYLHHLEEAVAANPDWAAITGRVIRDGATTEGLTWEQGIQALQDARDIKPPKEPVEDLVGAYGCNMSIRASMVQDLRFDERLVLYGWQEDTDFTSQLRSRGRVVRDNRLIGVHLGVKSGRVSGERFGYSQIVNPVYLIRKGSVPANYLLPLLLRNVLMNTVRSLKPESYVDRRGRLRGNLLGMLHLARGRVEPEYIVEL